MALFEKKKGRARSDECDGRILKDEIGDVPDFNTFLTYPEHDRASQSGERTGCGAGLGVGDAVAWSLPGPGTLSPAQLVRPVRSRRMPRYLDDFVK